MDMNSHITYDFSFYKLTNEVVEKLGSSPIEFSPEEIERIRVAVWVSAKTAKELVERSTPPTILENGETDLAALTKLRDEIAYSIGNAMRSQALWEEHQEEKWEAAHFVVRYLAAVHLHCSAKQALAEEAFDDLWDDQDNIDHRVDEDLRAMFAGEWKRVAVSPPPFEEE